MGFYYIAVVIILYYRHDRTDARAGDDCAFVKQTYSYKCISLPQEFSHLEVLCFDMLCNDFKHRFIYVYRPLIMTSYRLET